MSKVTVSLLMAVLIGGVAVVGLNVMSDDKGSAEIVAEVRGLEELIESTRSELHDVSNRLAKLESANIQLAAATAATGRAVAENATASDGEGTPAAAALAIPTDLEQAVFALIEKDRKLREEQREAERQQARERMEERREEFAQMREGPYDRFNLKVNSMGKLLALSDVQKAGYHELTKKYTELADEQRNKMREEMRAKMQQAREGQEGQEGEEGGGRRGGRGGRGGFDREAMEQYRKAGEEMQNQYVGELANILSAQQLDTFENLPGGSQSFSNLGAASTEGDRGRGGMTQAFGQRGGGQRGGGGGGRGGR